MHTIPETLSPVNAEPFAPPHLPASVMKFVIAVIEMRTLQRRFFREGKRMARLAKQALVADAKAAEGLVDRLAAGMPITPEMLPEVRAFVVAVVTMRTLQRRFFAQTFSEDRGAHLVAEAKVAERRVDELAAALFLRGAECQPSDNLFAEEVH